MLKNLVAINSISKETRRPVGTRPGIMYRIWKVHKDIIDTSPPFDLFCQ